MSCDHITGFFYDLFSRKKERTTFRRGTSFSGTLNIFGDDPHDILKKRFKAKTRELEDFNSIVKLLHEFEISKNEMNDFIGNFVAAMELGLKSKQADLKMIPTFVTNIPNGKEVGEYLALDLGGTNFRVLRMVLNGDPSKVIVSSNGFSVPETIMRSFGNTLFEFIADKIVIFFNNQKMDKTVEYKLGFTFSFPCDQKSLKHGTLVNWTKGFECPDIVNKDVVSLLQIAINKRELNVKVVALVNDTVGTLMACAFTNPDCSLGMIVGTGTNACYIEEIENIRNRANIRSKSKYMVINIEWGAFGDKDPDFNIDRFITTFDEEIDMASVNPGMQKFEKLISGMYMGEVVRKIILHLIEKGLLFKRSESHSESLKMDMGALHTPNAFYSRYVSEIETDRGKRFKKTKNILKSIGIPKPSLYDCAIVHFVCRLVSKRAAKLLACAMSAVLMKMNRTDLTIGVDGSLYRHHPTFMRDVELECHYLLPAHINYKVALAADGSGIGAALAAAASTI